MRKQPRGLAILLVVLALVSTACSGSSDLAETPTTVATATSDTSDADPTSTAASSDSEDDPAPADDNESAAGVSNVKFEDTFVSFGNPDAEAVIVVAQGGPLPFLDDQEAKSLFDDLDLDEIEVVLPHQAQTLDSDRFTSEEISFDEAKEFDTASTEMLANVVEHHVNQGRVVAVVGISFGAFVVQDLLATQGNIADGYVIQVGRLDMPAEVWEQFAEGRFVGFIDGVEVMDVDADGAGMGGDTPLVDANMAKLAAGLGHKRYTELLADIDLDNVVYAYGEIDEQVGRLTADELAFLEAKGVRVLATSDGHGDTVDDTLIPGLELLFGDGADAIETDEAAEGDSSEDVGYLPAEDVAAYVDAYAQGLAASSVTIDGQTLPIEYAGIESAITINVDGGSVSLALGDRGLEDAQVRWQERQWVVQEEPDVTAMPGPLGGDGDQIAMAFTAVSADEAAESIDVELNLDINVIGMGASIVEVVEGYATISGTLGTSTYVQLSDVIENNPEVDTLVMLNVNGSENDEINVHTARLIRAAGWTTWVPANGDISSGGVDMFVAGVDRIIEPGGFAGVHSWGAEPGEPTGRDYPRDSPVHRSQLEYFTEMMGDEAGTEFYFYTLEASPFEQIYRMTPTEITQYGLTTAEAPMALPETVTGPPAGYLNLAEGTYVKLQVLACDVTNDDISAELISTDLGPVELTSGPEEAEMSFPALEGFAPVEHTISAFSISDGVLSGDVDLDFEVLTGDLDTSNASFALPCPS